MEYLIFEGVRDMPAVIRILLKLTDLDIRCAPHLIAVTLAGSDPGVFLDNPELLALDDSPEGFWSMDVCDRDYLLDRIEEAYRRAGKRMKKHSS